VTGLSRGIKPGRLLQRAGAPRILSGGAPPHGARRFPSARFPMTHKIGPSRRRFLRAAAAAGSLALAGPLRRGKRVAASDRLALGFIGVGTMGRHHVERFLRYPEVQVVAVCDVVAERREHSRKKVEDHYAAAKKGGFTGCDGCTDFRKVLDRKDVDAV